MEMHELENQLGLTFPHGYRMWYQNAYFDRSASNSAYLWVNDAEWLRIEEIPFRSMWRDNLIGGLVPFAFTGGGDNWCWNTNHKSTPHDYEVLLCYRDDDLAAAYAPTFASWFYRTCLDYACCIENAPDEIHKARRYLQLWSNRMREICSNGWAEHLHSLSLIDPTSSVKQVRDRTFPEFGFISHEAVIAIVAEEFGVEYVDRTLEYARSN